MTTTAEPVDPKVAKAKAFLKEQAEKMAGLETSQKTMLEQISALAGTVKSLSDEVKKIDLKSVLTEIERMKAGHTQVMRNIQKASAFKIAGAEDLAPKFSLIKALVSVKTGGQQFGDSEEYALMKEVRKSGGAQAIGVGSDGGWFVPDQVIPDVIASLYRRSVFLDLAGDGQTRVSVIDGLTGAQVRIPKFKKGVVAYWGSELKDATLSKVGTGFLSMTPKKINALTRLTEEQQRFGGYGFEQMLRNDMTRALAEEVDRAVAYGKGGADEPEGITKFGVNTYTAGTGGAAVHAVLDWTGISEMDLKIEEALLDQDGTFATVSSPAFFNYISNLRVLNYSGQAPADADYLAGLPPLTKARLADLIGNFSKTTLVPSNKNVGDAAAKATDVFRGNFGEILVGRWSGIEVVTEDNFDIVNDSRLVKLRLFMDTGCRYPAAITWCANAKARA